MKNLYIDFDGVIMNTIEITYEELKKLNLDSDNLEDQEKIRNFYASIDWNELLNKKASIINDAIKCIKKLIDSEQFNIAILSHVNSLDEAIEKVKYIRKHFKDITFIPVPRDIEKTEMVHVEDAILIDDYAGNLEAWKKAGGVAIKFSTKLNGKGFVVIDRLDQILELSYVNN